ncbi:oligosaccharide flippase family protein [Novosphingobium sp. PhB165]|uniref:oligosaccharide flippase family protein n=1 Tax=Novosphingobium sp. PhB165 TaxID=2485105 RepID=UPI001052AE75|nr:oligosaccharide flippase family protein [Novosphingobium sp. PhB165]
MFFPNAAPAAEPGSAPSRNLIDRIKGLALRDTNVVVVTVILNNLLRAVSGMILTRLLVPEVFGISGIVASIQFAATMSTDFGFQPFVVRHKNGDDPRFLDTVWTASLIRALFLALVLVVCARPIAMLLEKPELALIIAVSSLTFVLDGFSSSSMLTALRQRLVLRLSAIDIVVLVVQIAVSAVLAYFWRSYWAILAGMLTNGTLKLVLSYVMFDDSFRKFRLDRDVVQELWSFARYITGSSLIFLVISQCDKFVLAKVMSLNHFGLYVLAGNLASAPLAFAMTYASRVLYPTYAQLWRDGHGDLKAKFYERRKIPSLLYTFATGGIIGAAPIIVKLFYSARYAEAAIYLQVLSISSLLALSSNAGNEALLAAGHVRASLEASISKLVWLAFAGVAGFVFYGEFGLIVAVGVMELPALLVKWVRMQKFDLLDLRQELFYLAAGPVGVACGLGADLVIGPLLH